MKTKNNNTISSIKRGLRTTLLGIIVSVFLAAIKIFTGIIGNSYALIADGIESLSDIFTSSIVLTGLYFASKPADENHPYGHGKAEPFAGIAVSFGIFIAAMIIVVQSIYEIITPHHAPAPFTLIVLVLVIITKETLFRFVIKVGMTVNSVAVKSDAWHHRSDAITSLAAGLGISIALLGGGPFQVADDLAELVAASIIAWNGWRLLRRALAELMDRSPNPELLDHIRSVATQVAGVDRIEKCLARKMGYHYYVEMHVQVDPDMTVQRSHDLAHEVKDQVTTRLPAVRDVLVHIEPARRER